jgi:Tfp pilus assembly protein PilN
MVRQLLKYGNTFCAIEHSSDENSTDLFFSLTLKKSKNELIVERKEQSNSKEELLLTIKTQKHAFLVINNQQVLFKKIEEIHKDVEQLVKMAFPTIKVSEFYYEILQNKNESIVAICRKEYVNKLIEEYNSHDISIINFSLYNLSIQHLLPYVVQDKINSSNAVITIRNKSISSIERSTPIETNYTINNLAISNKHLLCLAGIISYYSDSVTDNINYIDFQNQLQKQYRYKRFYYLGLKIALGFLFSVLLINFMIFNNAHSKMTTLNSELLVNGSNKNTIIRLQERVDRKTELVNNLTSLSASKTTWQLNELGKSVPNKTQLTELKFQPITSTIKKRKKITIDKNSISVKGTSKDNNSFSNWITELEQKNWIEKVVVISYGKGKLTTATFEFIITVRD